MEQTSARWLCRSTFLVILATCVSSTGCEAGAPSGSQEERADQGEFEGLELLVTCAASHFEPYGGLDVEFQLVNHTDGSVRVGRSFFFGDGRPANSLGLLVSTLRSDAADGRTIEESWQPLMAHDLSYEPEVLTYSPDNSGVLSRVDADWQAVGPHGEHPGVWLLPGQALAGCIALGGDWREQGSDYWDGLAGRAFFQPDMRVVSLQPSGQLRGHEVRMGAPITLSARALDDEVARAVGDAYRVAQDEDLLIWTHRVPRGLEDQRSHSRWGTVEPEEPDQFQRVLRAARAIGEETHFGALVIARQRLSDALDYRDRIHDVRSDQPVATLEEADCIANFEAAMSELDASLEILQDGQPVLAARFREYAVLLDGQVRR